MTELIGFHDPEFKLNHRRFEVPVLKTRRKSPVNLVATEPHQCSIDLRMRILGRLPFFAGLPRKAVESINQRFVEVGYQPGERIYTAGDPAERLYVVAEGKIKVLQHAAGGRDVLLDILSTGEFFGNLAALGVALYTDSAEAQAPTCVLSIRSDSFRQILDEHPELALKALDVMAARLNDANQRVMQLSSMPVEKRIAITLLKLARKLGRRQDDMLLIDVPLSRDNLAEMTSATPETVSRVMSQLQAGAVIASGRQWVGIRDERTLEEMAGDA
ncbi:Crp/Fnr family transcriptional regulator [bacterium]|nr:MAG: Crp/Fnr family transcriptional regulator [bacterium]